MTATDPKATFADGLDDMIDYFGYLLILVGFGVSMKGYVGMRAPEIYKDEAKQAFWGAVGIYVFLLGGACLVFGIHIITS